MKGEKRIPKLDLEGLSIYQLLDVIAEHHTDLKLESLRPQNERNNPKMRRAAQTIARAATQVWAEHRNRLVEANAGIPEHLR